MLCRSNKKLWNEQSQICEECENIPLFLLLKYMRVLGIPKKPYDELSGKTRKEWICEQISTYISINFPRIDNRRHFINDVVEISDKTFGKGCNGVVKKAVLKTNQYSTPEGYNEGDVVAVKILDVDKVDYNTLKEFENVRKLSKSCSNYVSTYLDVLFDEYSSKLYFIMEPVKGISLRELINNEYIMHQLKKESIWPLVKQLIMGLLCIHKSGFAHRDIHEGNIMISGCYDLDKNDCKVKYIDFGRSCFNQECQNEEEPDLWFHQARDVHYLVEIIQNIVRLTKKSNLDEDTSRVINHLPTGNIYSLDREGLYKVFSELYSKWRQLDDLQ